MSNKAAKVEQIDIMCTHKSNPGRRPEEEMMMIYNVLMVRITEILRRFWFYTTNTIFLKYGRTVVSQ